MRHSRCTRLHVPSVGRSLLRLLPSSMALLVALIGTTSLSIAQDYQPEIAPESEEARLAMEGFRLPPGMSVHLFAAEPMLANPVAFCIDAQGRIYVAETFRQGKGVEDNRGHMNWLEDDLSLQTVDERVAMFKKYLGEDAIKYTLEHDRIRLLTDSNEDGQADQSTVFADGFHQIEEGTGAGLLARNGDVYYTCIPRLWTLRDEDHDGRADDRRALLDGFGVRVAFRGHDMHGLIMGPDGKLYFSIGDRGYNVDSQEGEQFKRPDTGAVFRCNPDGSQFEVFAYGLRNPQELAFDDYGNLFTGDNNSDSGDLARWVHVVEGGDSGWRMYYQYLDDRGPWNRSRMWYPYRADEETTQVQPAYIVPPIANMTDGPSGLACYPGTGLPARYDGHFFLVDFRGTGVTSGVWAFDVNPKGATFELGEPEQFIWSILATDVDFGYDGRMYVSDWVDGWNGTGKGRIYAFEHDAAKKDPTVAEVTRLMHEGFAQRSQKELATLLAHKDRRIRQEAQFALVARKGAGDTLLNVARDETHQLARLHAVWGLGQLMRRQLAVNNPSLGDQLVTLLAADDVEVRSQVLRVLGDARHPATAEVAAQLSSDSPREQFFALMALSKMGRGAIAGSDAPSPEGLLSKLDIEQIKAVLIQNDNQDPMLRHAAVMALTTLATDADLLAWAHAESAAVRLASLLALRRRQHPAVAEFLSDHDESLVVEAARAIHDLPIADALPQLAALADRPDMPEALLRRVMNANFRLGGAQQAEALASLAVDDAISVDMRREATTQLLNWSQPPVLDRVTNEWRPLPQRPADVARPAVEKVIDRLIAPDSPLQREAVQLAGIHRLPAVNNRLVTLLADHTQPEALRAEALRTLAEIESPDLAKVVDDTLADEAIDVRSEAQRLLVKLDPDRAVPLLSGEIKSGSESRISQRALKTLATIETPAARATLLEWATLLGEGKVSGFLELDIIEAIQDRQEREFQDALARYESTRTDAQLSQYRETLTGGDGERGKVVFFGFASASCRRCHKVYGDGSDVGPDLSKIAVDKPREYLLEAIVNPNAKIAKGFETKTIVTDEGRVYSGIIKEQTDDTLQLMLPTGEKVLVQKETIDFQAEGKSGMPEDLIKNLTKRDIRDLVEYLTTLDGTGGDAAAHGKTEE